MTRFRTSYAAREHDDYEYSRLLNTLKTYNARSDYPGEVLQVWEKLGECEPFKDSDSQDEPPR